MKVLSEGIELLAGCTAIFYSLDWNPASEKQAFASMLREGKFKQCKAIYIVARISIDGHVVFKQGVKMQKAEVFGELHPDRMTAPYASNEDFITDVNASSMLYNTFADPSWQCMNREEIDVYLLRKSTVDQYINRTEATNA